MWYCTQHCTIAVQSITSICSIRFQLCLCVNLISQNVVNKQIIWAQFQLRNIPLVTSFALVISKYVTKGSEPLWLWTAFYILYEETSFVKLLVAHFCNPPKCLAWRTESYRTTCPTFSMYSTYYVLSVRSICDKSYYIGQKSNIFVVCCIPRTLCSTFSW